MQRNIFSLLGFSLHAIDGEVGKVEEFYFDDKTWTVRYLVVKTHKIFSNRLVLISPVSIGRFIWEDGTFPVNLSKKQIKNSPDIDTDKPVSRQHEAVLNAYYLWEPYWDDGFYGPAVCDESNEEFIEKERLLEVKTSDKVFDIHLRSTRWLTGYKIQATDGEIGQLSDFVIDDDSWKLKYIIVSITSKNKLRNVLVSVNDIREIRFEESKIYLNITGSAVLESEPLDKTKYTTRRMSDKMYR
jgi:sporulation protein YlmC with PRC-barrel domain